MSSDYLTRGAMMQTLWEAAEQEDLTYPQRVLLEAAANLIECSFEPVQSADLKTLMRLCLKDALENVE